MHDVEPLVALRRRAAGAARAIRIAERQPHLVGEIGAQEIDEVGAIGAQAQRSIVFAETEIVEQQIARPVAQHFMPRLPRRLGVERRVEQFLDPCRIADFPSRDSSYCAPARRCPRRARRSGGFGRADGDVAGDRAAAGRRVVERQRRVPGARGRRGDLGEPGIGRPAVPVRRFGGDAAIGRDQRKLAAQRLFGDDHDAQRRALPRRERRGQDRDLGGVRASAGRRFGAGGYCCEKQQGRCSNSKRARAKHMGNLPEACRNRTGPCRRGRAGKIPNWGGSVSAFEGDFAAPVSRHAAAPA